MAAGKNLHLTVELRRATEAQFTRACIMSQSSSTILNVQEIWVPEYSSVAMACDRIKLIVWGNCVFISFNFRSMCIYETASVGKFSA